MLKACYLSTKVWIYQYEMYHSARYWGSCCNRLYENAHYQNVVQAQELYLGPSKSVPESHRQHIVLAHYPKSSTGDRGP